MVELTRSFLLDYESLDQEHQRLADIVDQVVQAIDNGEADKCKSLVSGLVKSAK